MWFSGARKLESLDEAYIREEPGGANLHLMFRMPHDASQPIRGFRVHATDSDMVAGLSLEFQSCAGLVELFDAQRQFPFRGEWCSEDGDWKIQIDCDDTGKRLLTSEVTSQVLYHPWFVRTTMEIDAKQFLQVCSNVRRFIGTYE